MALGSDSFLTKGVDSVHRREDTTEVADNIAQHRDLTIIVSGATDYVTDGIHTKKIRFGSSIMKSITSMGCCLTAITAAMLSTIHKPFEAAIIGTQYFSLCGELVSQQHKKPGFFKSAFIDIYAVLDHVMIFPCCV